MPSIWRQHGEISITFDRDLAFPVGIVYFHRPLAQTNGSDERPAIGRHSDTLFRCRSGSNLLRFAFRVALAPEVKVVACARANVDPIPVWGPCRTRARRAGGPYLLTGASRIERHHTTRQPFPIIHFG